MTCLPLVIYCFGSDSRSWRGGVVPDQVEDPPAVRSRYLPGPEVLVRVMLDGGEGIG
jgi:hypothetical protein